MWGSCGLTWVFSTRGWEEIDILVKQLVPVVVAAALWGGLWRGKHICFHSDNMAVVSILSTKTAKSPPPLMHLLRCFSFYCALYCINVSCVHVPGAINAAADALSHNKLPLFSSLPTGFTIPHSSFPGGNKQAGLGVAGLDRVVCSLIDRGIAESTLRP